MFLEDKIGKRACKYLRTPEMKDNLEKIMRDIIYGFGYVREDQVISNYAARLKNKIKDDANDNVINDKLLENYKFVILDMNNN